MYVPFRQPSPLGLPLAGPLFLVLVAVSGCSALRWAPGESQRQNAHLHARTTALAAEQARAEGASPTLQEMLALSVRQAEAFPAYFGPPAAPAPVAGPADLLGPGPAAVADAAVAQAQLRPPEAAEAAWQVALALLSLVGGATGVRIAAYLRALRQDAVALREVVLGNERLKTAVPDLADAFRSAHRGQSAETRRRVATVRCVTLDGEPAPA